MRNTSFRPTVDQEEALVQFCLDRLTTLTSDNADRIKADRYSWEAYNNDQAKRINPDGVFKDEEHNLALPLTAMIVESFISRAEDQITGSDTYTNFIPQGHSANDELKANEFNHYFRWKLETVGKTKSTLEDAYTAIFVQRAAVFKAVWSDKTAEWEDHETNVLWEVRKGVDGQESAEPLRYPDPNGNPKLIVENETEQVEVEGPTGQPIRVLAEDPSVVIDPMIHAWRPSPQGLRRTATLYRGPKAELLDYDAFLCPSNVRSIEDADVVAERYDKPLSWVESTFYARPWLKWDAYVAGASVDAKSKTEIERNENQENRIFDEKTRMVKLVEFWVRRDVLGWGRPQEFIIIIDVDQRKAVYYEFQAIVCPDLRRPFVAIAIGRQKNVWWGYSLPEKIKQYQQFADRQFQREASRNELNANPIGVANPQVVEEEPEHIDLGRVYTAKKAGTRARDLIDFAEIPDLDTRTQTILEFIIYMVQLWLGVSNLSQGDYADVPENSTKYGIEASLREASKLGRRWMRRIIRGFEDLLTKMAKLQLSNLNQDEVYTVTEGKATTLATMKPEMAQGMEFDVALVIQPEVRQMDIQAAQTALAVQERYFMAPAPVQIAMRPLMEKILNALAFSNVDELLPIPVINPMAPPAPAVEVASGAAQPQAGNWPGEQAGNDGTQGQKP